MTKSYIKNYVKAISLHFSESENLSSQQYKDTENIINSKYYNIDQIRSLDNLNHRSALSLFHTKNMKKLFLKNIEEIEYQKEKLILM